MDVAAMVSVSGAEDFCGSLSFTCSHERFIVGISVAYFSAVDHIHVKGEPCVVSGVFAV
jgi:hypothetical protein